MERYVVNDFLVIVGGENHLGWLPDNAVVPMPNPVREKVFDFEIVGTSGAYIFKFYSQCGEVMGDNWYQFLEDAMAQAQQKFGVPVDVWRETKI